MGERRRGREQTVRISWTLYKKFTCPESLLEILTCQARGLGQDSFFFFLTPVVSVELLQTLLLGPVTKGTSNTGVASGSQPLAGAGGGGRAE